MQVIQTYPKEKVSKLTSKGQVTIPIEVRKKLGVEAHDKVAFVIEEDEVKLIRSNSVVEKTAGALKTELPVISASKLREKAEEAIASEVVKR